MTNEETRLSVAMALEQVREKTDTVRRLNAELDFERKDRNRHIKDALRYVPISRLMHTTGLSRDMLYRIKNSPDD